MQGILWTTDLDVVSFRVYSDPMWSKNLQVKLWHKQEIFMESQMPTLCKTVQPQSIHRTTERELWAHDEIANVSKL